jgi:hypothetical protein
MGGLNVTEGRFKQIAVELFTRVWDRPDYLFGDDEFEAVTGSLTREELWALGEKAERLMVLAKSACEMRED